MKLSACMRPHKAICSLNVCSDWLLLCACVAMRSTVHRTGKLRHTYERISTLQGLTVVYLLTAFWRRIIRHYTGGMAKGFQKGRG